MCSCHSFRTWTFQQDLCPSFFEQRWQYRTEKKKPILYLRQLRQIATGKLLLLFMEEFLTRACEGAGCIRLGVLQDIKERLASTQMLIARLMRTDSVSTQRAEPSCPFSSLPAGTAFLEWFLPTSYPLCP